MTDRQVQAVADAIHEECRKPYTIYGIGFMERKRLAKAAIEASDAKYVPMLVEALRKIAEARHPTGNGDLFASYSWLRQYACEALNSLPEEVST
jgi:hypothetical protein